MGMRAARGSRGECRPVLLTKHFAGVNRPHSVFESHIILASCVVVGNLNVRRPCFGPNEADPELVIDADAVLSCSITYQRFEAITRRRFQVLKHGRGLEHRELASRDFAYRAETPRFLCPE